MFSTSLARLWELWAGFFCLFWLIALTLKFKISRQSLLTAKGLKKSIGLFGRFFHAFMALQKATSKAVKTKGTEMQIYYVFSTFVIVWDLPLHPFYCRSSTMNCSLKGICHWPIDDDGHLVWFSLFLLLCGLFKEKYDFWASQNFAVNINCFFFFPRVFTFFSHDVMISEFSSYQMVFVGHFHTFLSDAHSILLTCWQQVPRVVRWRAERMKEDDKLTECIGTFICSVIFNQN